MKIESHMKIVNNKTLFAVGSVSLDGVLNIQPVKVLCLEKDGKESYSVSLPRKRGKDGQWNNVIVIKDPELRKKIEKTVLDSVRAAAMDYVEFQNVDVEVRPYRALGSDICGYATLRYAGSVEIQGIQIKKRDNEYKVIYPYNIEHGDFQSLVSPISIVREGIENKVIEAYEERVRGLNNHDREKSTGPVKSEENGLDTDDSNAHREEDNKKRQGGMKR